MNTKKSAFTLIELLVVIAIIAILAAILFPVFAQARTAAKKIVASSNQKQVLTAFVLYGTDYDDMYPKRGTMNGNGASWTTGSCNVEDWGCPTWDKTIYKYQKNIEVLESGLDRSPRKPTNLGTLKRSFRVASNLIRGVGGVNTWGGSTETNVVVYSTSSVPAPSNTIMLTEQRNEAQFASGGSYIWYTFWEQWVWATGSLNTLAYTDVNAAQLWSGIDYKSGGNVAIFGFADTHVKAFPKGYIFPGYRRARAYNTPVVNNLPGVCLDADDFSGNGPANDCPLPQE
jgi:prepilin-type N-terminal cleavage/methylation domain-containing protein